MMHARRENNSSRMGFRDGIPIFLGYIPVSFAFGLFATSSGLSILEALLISAFNMTSAGQLAAVPIFTIGGSYIELALTQLTINMRYSLMSVSLSQRFGEGIRLGDRFAIAFANTDEIFAVAIGKETPLGRRYMYSLIALPYIGWCLGTLLGAVAGNVLPEILINALGIALYAMFIAIIVPASRGSRATALCVLASVAASCLFRYAPYLKEIPDGFVIMICAVGISLLFAFAAPISEEGEVTSDD